MPQVVKSFPPVLPENPKILILGAMPGAKSLEAGEYYAHPQNGFWTIMGEIFSFSPFAPYSERISALRQNGVALWDALKFCERKGSLDSDIKPETEKPNDVCTLLAETPSVRAVFFNGAKPLQCFSRHIRPFLEDGVKSRLHIEKLPSTSPANAGMKKERKAVLWAAAVKPFL